MPKRTDLRRILLVGSGPIVIGQAAEFDYSGTQAVKALKEEGYAVVLVNSNPATIMTDPELADRTYVEPVTPEWVRKVIERGRHGRRRRVQSRRVRGDGGARARAVARAHHPDRAQCARMEGIRARGHAGSSR